MRYFGWKRARYAVPAAVLVGLGVAAFVPTLSGASVPPGLPAQTPQQLLADMAAAKVPPLSGTLSWQPYLGLSDLSALEPGGGQGGDGSGFDPLTLLSASYQVNVWLDGATAEHLALIEPSAQEIDLVRNGHQAWLWDSSNQSVLHVIGAAPASQSTSTGTGTSTNEMPLTPDQLASRLLSHRARARR